jgi:hypothetical protein
MLDKERMDAVDRKVLGDIERHGWAAISVFATEEELGQPGTEAFTYTVGLLAEHNHPDLIVMGMMHEQAHSVLYSAYQAILRGVRFTPDTYSTEVLAGLRVAFLEVLDPLGAYPMSMVNHLFGQVIGYQLVWPDAADRFPWDSDFAEEYRDRQPLLGIWGGA